MCYILERRTDELSLFAAIISAAISGEQLSPHISTSQNYKHWVSIEDFKRCIICAENHGAIWLIADTPLPAPLYTQIAVAELSQCKRSKQVQQHLII